MKHWGGNDFEYRGCTVHNNKKEHFLEVYDNRGSLIFKIDSFGGGSVTTVKSRIDRMINDS